MVEIIGPHSFKTSTKRSWTGVLWLRIDSTPFPYEHWDDFVIPIFAALCAAAHRIANFGSGSERIYFMDGPYTVRLRSANNAQVHVTGIGRGDVSGIVSVESLLAQLLTAAEPLLSACGSVTVGDCNYSDVQRLIQAVEGLRAAEARRRKLGC
jgi:hypothetical protein